jgi:hypothetical protein
MARVKQVAHHVDVDPGPCVGVPHYSISCPRPDEPLTVTRCCTTTGS